MSEALERLLERVGARAAEAAKEGVRRLLDLARQGKVDLAQAERLAHGCAQGIGRAVLEAVLETMGNGKTTSHRACACGGTRRYVSDRPKELSTLLGPVTIRRAYYHCSACGEGDFPLDRNLGVEGVSLTPGTQEVVAWADAEVAYGRAAQFLQRTLGWSLSKDAHETLSGSLGEAVQPQETERARDAWKGLPAAEQLYITLDGVKVNTDEGWKEPKLGAVFRAHRGADGNPVRGPTRYVAHLEEAEAFGERLWQLAEAAGAEKARHLVVLGDGAPWIWNLADFHFPHAVQIVDFWHAVEKLAEIARAHWGDDRPEAKQWLEARKKALHDGNVAGVLRALHRLPIRGRDPKEILRKAIGYFRENRHRMRYDLFRAQGCFIGSGVVEAGCKSVIAHRFKQSGMRWSIDGFLKLLHLRLCIVNNDWDAFARSRFPILPRPSAAYF